MARRAALCFLPVTSTVPRVIGKDRNGACVALALAMATVAPASADPGDTHELRGTPVSTGFGKGVTLRIGDFGGSLTGRFQPRVDLETAAGKPALALPTVTSVVPYVRRARLKLQLCGFDKRVSATAHLGFAEAAPDVKDLYLNLRPLGTRWLQLRAGQFKKPFSRQQMLSTTKLVLVDRAASDEYYDAGRELGVELFGGGNELPAFWAVGVFTGTALTTPDSWPTLPAPGSGAPPLSTVPAATPLIPTLAARAVWNFRDPGQSEQDLEGGPLRAAVGASGYVRSDLVSGSAARAVVNVDGVVKWQGLAVNGAVFASSSGRPGLGTHGPESIAADARASYSFRRVVEVAIGGGTVVPVQALEEAVHDLRLGMTGYFLPTGHLKVGFDVGPQVEGMSLERVSLVGRAHVLLLF